MRARKILTSLFFAGFGFSCAAFAEMPVDRVILSTSGLAQFEHRAQVTGDATLEFPARLDQVDDILKSLVVFDAKGRIGSVTLPGRQPLDQIFKDLPFDRAALTSAVKLLNAYQGAVVTVKGAELAASGKIIQVVPEVVSLEGGKAVTKHRLTLVTPEGLKQAVLEDLQSFQFDDKKVQAEIDRALDAIRENGAAGRRTLSVKLLGKEQRDVTLAYVVPAPLWKTAYRMVVPATGKDKGLLQGWAIVENMTASDWKDVDLSLTSGNPVTFHQALYPSYYASRPDVPVQVSGVSLPRVDQGSVGTADVLAEWKKEAPRSRAAMSKTMALNAPAAAQAMEMADGAAAPAFMTGADQMAGMAQAATSSEAATHILFHFPDRLSLSAGQSMMLPFVSRDVPMTPVSIYQPETNAKHPLAAVEIKNDGESSLPPGVLTLYEESDLLKGTNFVGDAQMAALGKGEARVVPYALDQKTTIDRADKSTSTEGQVTASGGVIRTALKNVNETVYTVKAPAAEARTVVIEHPRIGADYKLVEPDPKGVEVTDTHYRFKLALKPGETKTLKVVLENQFWQSFGVSDLSAEQLAVYAGQKTLSEPVRKALNEVAEARRAVEDVDQKIADLDDKKQGIFDDQERVRENLKSLEGKSEVQQKYLDKLNAQEDEVGKLDQERAALSAQRGALMEALSKKLAALQF